MVRSIRSLKKCRRAEKWCGAGFRREHSTWTQGSPPTHPFLVWGRAFHLMDQNEKYPPRRSSGHGLSMKLDKPLCKGSLFASSLKGNLDRQEVLKLKKYAWKYMSVGLSFSFGKEGLQSLPTPLLGVFLGVKVTWNTGRDAFPGLWSSCLKLFLSPDLLLVLVVTSDLMFLCLLRKQSPWTALAWNLGSATGK